MAAVVVIQTNKDAAVVLGLAAALFVAGIISALAPVVRAAKIDPIVALRYE
jgi:ABC-type antimicrobial peptide transport system permease subunit